MTIYQHKEKLIQFLYSLDYNIKEKEKQKEKD